MPTGGSAPRHGRGGVTARPTGQPTGKGSLRRCGLTPSSVRFVAREQSTAMAGDRLTPPIPPFCLPRHLGMPPNAERCPLSGPPTIHRGAGHSDRLIGQVARAEAATSLPGLHRDWLTPVLTDQPARSARWFRRRNLGAHGAPLVPAAGRQLPLTPSSLAAEDKSAILRVGS
jgi:hypothetical protein